MSLRELLLQHGDLRRQALRESNENRLWMFQTIHRDLVLPSRGVHFLRSLNFARVRNRRSTLSLEPVKRSFKTQTIAVQSPAQ